MTHKFHKISPLHLTIGYNGKLLRIAAGLSQTEAAKKLNIEVGSLNKLENGKLRFGIDRLDEMADLYGASWNAFRGRTDAAIQDSTERGAAIPKEVVSAYANSSQVGRLVIRAIALLMESLNGAGK